MTRAPGVSGELRIVDGVAHVTLAGELDLHAAADVTALLHEAVASGAASVSVDLALVSFCDAMGLGMLVRASNAMTSRGGELSLERVPVKLRRLLAITGLTGALHTAPVDTADELLGAELAAAARLPLVRNVLDAALDLVVVMSAAVMAGADGVSVTLPRDGRLRTVAASNDVVLSMDHDQYDTGEGPCLDAARQGEPFSSTALALEHRWPRFVPRARAHGIESIMSTPLLAGDHPVGALNVYSNAAGALADHEQEWAFGFARQASAVLLAADTSATAATMSDDIGAALESRETIAQAQGVIMMREDLTREDALRFLADTSRRTSIPLIQVSRNVLASIRRPVRRGLDETATPGGR